MANFPSEPTPREWLLSLFLEEAVPPDSMEFYSQAISKAEKGQETLGISGNAVGVDIYPDRVAIEELFFENEPQSTEITLLEAKSLLAEWQKIIHNWRANVL